MADMERRLSELADYVGGRVIGDGDTLIKGVMTIETATRGYITFISNPKYAKQLQNTGASAVIVSPSMGDAGAEDNVARPLLVVKNPYLAFAKIVDLMMHTEPFLSGTVDPSSEIGGNVRLGVNVTICRNVIVGANAVIGDDAALYPGVNIGEGCEIGASTVIHPNAVVYRGCRIGRRVVIHSNVVIGSPGFGYVPDGGRYFKIPHVGTVVIEDDVDIEPNTTVSRASLGETRIRRGAKIGANVVIAHGVDIGEDTLIVSQSGVAGSSRVGKNVTIAGQSGISGHITVGDNVRVGARSGVANDLPPDGAYLGSPAMPIGRMRKCYAVISQLPEMRKVVKALKKRVGELEGRLRG